MAKKMTYEQLVKEGRVHRDGLIALAFILQNDISYKDRTKEEFARDVGLITPDFQALAAVKKQTVSNWRT
jgi:hypothetical protein